jgi:MFS family permease
LRNPELKTNEHWLNRDIFGMGLASFFSDLGHEMATAVLPAFLASIGAAPFALGTIEGVADGISSGVKLLSGWYSDRTGRRKPIAVLGYFITGVSTGAFGFATSWVHILIARSAAWFGRGIRGAPRDALLAESSSPAVYGKVFGFHRAADTAGAVLGPVAAALLVTAFAYHQIFWITFIPGILSGLAFALLVRERRRTPNHNLKFVSSMRDLPRSFKFFLVAVGIFGIGDFAHSLLILRATRALAPSLGTARAAHIAIIFYALHNILYALFAFPVGALGDRISKRSILVVGYLVGSVMSVILAVLVPSLWMLALVFILGGILLAVEDAMEGSIAASLLPDQVRASGFGALAAVNGMGDLVSSMVVGTLWTVISPIAGFGYAAVLMGLGSVVMWKATAK